MDMHYLGPYFIVNIDDLCSGVVVIVWQVGKIKETYCVRWEVSDLHFWDVWGLLGMCGQGLM